MQQGKLDEAISWLGKAKQARRYEPRQFPFMNLGRVYLKQGRWWGGTRFGSSRAPCMPRRRCISCAVS